MKQMDNPVRVKDMYRFGLYVNVVTIGLMVGLYHLRFGEAQEVLMRVVKGFVLMLPVAILLGRRDPQDEEVNAALGSWLLLGLNAILGLSFFVFLMLGRRPDEFSWMLIVLGVWTGNKTGWLLAHLKPLRPPD